MTTPSRTQTWDPCWHNHAADVYLSNGGQPIIRCGSCDWIENVPKTWALPSSLSAGRWQGGTYHVLRYR